MRGSIRQALTRSLAVALALALAAAGVGPAFAGPHILVDVKSAKVIEHEDAFQKWYPASLTKLMTAYTVFQQLRAGRVTLATPVIMSKAAAGQPASKLYLKPGDSLSLDDALKVLLVKSANDVAYAIAETVGGTMPGFVELMNRNAASLGMSSTRFINPNGLPGKGQYTTARDLAVLAVTIRREFPEYAGYFSLEGVKIGKKQYGNYNKLIGRFYGADGMKTGFICASGFNQVSSATRNGRTVLSVVLGSENLIARAELSATLLEKGLASSKSFGFTALGKLQPYGATRDTVMDMTQAICKKKGKKVRSEGQDDVAAKVISRYSMEIGRPLDVALITIIPAGKTLADLKAANDNEPSEGDVMDNIPIPEPRPVN